MTSTGIKHELANCLIYVRCCSICLDFEEYGHLAMPTIHCKHVSKSIVTRYIARFCNCIR